MRGNDNNNRGNQQYVSKPSKMNDIADDDDSPFEKKHRPDDFDAPPF
jgi:hypothetical protein